MGRYDADQVAIRVLRIGEGENCFGVYLRCKGPVKENPIDRKLLALYGRVRRESVRWQERIAIRKENKIANKTVIRWKNVPLSPLSDQSA